MSKPFAKPFLPSFNNLEYASSVFTVLDKLCAHRRSWEENEYKNATTRLFHLLAVVYQVYEDEFVGAEDDDRRTLRHQLLSKLNDGGINARKSTDTLGLLIRYVFQADRRRLMAYKYSILAAKSHDIEPSAFAEWLVDKGGLDEVVRKVSFNAETLLRRQKVVNAINRIQEEISNRVDSPISTVNLPNMKSKGRVMLLAEPCGNGEFKILYVFEDPADGVQKALIRKAAAGKADVEAENSVLHTEASDFKRRTTITTLNKITRPEALVEA
jgi:hypothetical protein